MGAGRVIDPRRRCRGLPEHSPPAQFFSGKYDHVESGNALEIGIRRYHCQMTLKRRRCNKSVDVPDQAATKRGAKQPTDLGVTIENRVREEVGVDPVQERAQSSVVVAEVG
jgi:hypothetical protein